MTSKTTSHKIIIGSSMDLSKIPDKTIALVVTSPPYPMIEMWDEIFKEQDQTINFDSPLEAFEKMHNILNNVWKECDRVLIDGGIACINIGDATRTFNDNFQLFSNHSKIIQFFQSLHYNVLPDILWRKPSSAPNKFMGSGMYPPGAYVTYEHEYILVFRKGTKRLFKTNSDKELRRNSAYFWEERNNWFSDLWEIKGKHQNLNVEGLRERSAAFPFEIPYRLINMFSIKGDTVLDPFGGTGTTAVAASASERNSISVEYVAELRDVIETRLLTSKSDSNSYILNRLIKHNDFIESLSEDKLSKCYDNKIHNILVKTRQEIDLGFALVDSITINADTSISTSYKSLEESISSTSSNIVPPPEKPKLSTNTTSPTLSNWINDNEDL